MDSKVILSAVYVDDVCFVDINELVLMLLDLAEQEEKLSWLVESNMLRRLAKILIHGTRKTGS